MILRLVNYTQIYEVFAKMLNFKGILNFFNICTLYISSKKLQIHLQLN